MPRSGLRTLLRTLCAVGGTDVGSARRGRRRQRNILGSGSDGPAAKARVSPVAKGSLLGFPAMHVAYQGEPGAYSERAVQSLFPDAEPMPCDTVRLVFSRVTSGEARHGVVPLENSQAGSVNETYEHLQHTSLLRIGEVVVRVDHALLGVPGARLEEVRRAHSHWQALAQCEEFLSSMHIAPVPVHDTAGAARLIEARGDREDAAVASVEVAAALARGARGAHPDREGELYEVRGHLDRRSRSRPRRQDLARHGGAGSPGIAAGIAAALRLQEHQPAQAGIASPPREAVRVRLLRGSHGRRGLARCRRGVAEVAEHTSLLRVLGSYPSAGEPA